MKQQLSISRYGAYKDSGVEWLGEVPNDWRVAKVKSTCSHLRDGTHGSFERVDDGYPLLSVRNIVNSKFVLLSDDSCISELDCKSISKSLKIKEGDLQLAIVGATLGKVALVPANMPQFVTQRSLATLRPISKILSNSFLFYFAGNSYFQDSLWSKANYSAQPGVYLYTISNIDILLPPITEQVAIAAYLDSQTTQLDRKVELLTQKAAQYGKLKQSLINETVTRGLDKNVAMKDSGVEWIGEVPAHWEHGRIKDFVNTNAVTKVPTSLADSDLIEFLPMTNIDEALGKIKKFNYVPLKEVISGYTKFKNKDVIFAKITPCMENGNSAIVGNLSNNISYGSTEFMVFRAYKKLSEKFLHYYLHNDLFRRNAEPFMKGTAGQKRISSQFMETHFFALPPFAEQQAIAAYLDTQTAHINRIVTTINSQIDKLKELRKALINDIVTGKIKVA